MIAVRDRERGLSTVVNYVLATAVVAALLSGLVVGASGFVESQEERTVRSQLTVAGNQLASGLVTADGLADAAAPDGRIRLTVGLVDRVAGRTYRVTVRDDPDVMGYGYDLVLATETPAVAVTVSVRTARPVETGTVAGGALAIVYDGAAVDRLEVADG